MTGKTGLEKILMGSNTIDVMANCRCPLLVVPGTAAISPPETVILTTDLKDVEEKLVVPLLEQFLSSIPARLLVLNVAQKEGDVVHLRKEISDLHFLLDKYHPEYHYIDHRDAAEGINMFAADEDTGLIIILHRHQSGFIELFRKSVSRKLA